MTDLQSKVEEIERLAGKATPGPWTFRMSGSDFGFVGADGQPTVLFGEAHEGAVDADNPDAMFLVALRNAWPALREALKDAERWKALKFAHYHNRVSIKGDNGPIANAELDDIFMPDALPPTPKEDGNG